MKNKLTYLAPKGYRFNYNFFNGEFYNCDIIKESFLYCKSHNLIFDEYKEKEKLYNAKPNIFTDERFQEIDKHPFLGKTTKSIKRKLVSIKNLTDKNIKIKIIHKYYCPNKDIDLGLKLNIPPSKDSIKFNLNKNIDNINEIKDNKIKKLTQSLFDLGFIVNIYDNNDFLIGENIGGKFIQCFGFGKKVGFTEFNHSLKGYTNGENNILYDKFRNFDKWSRCKKINKENSIVDIIKTLTK